jgi:transposase
MPVALSFDLRSRIVHACQAGELTQPEIAELFEVHLNTVEKLWWRWRTTGSAAAKRHGGGTPARLTGCHEQLRQLIAERSDHSLKDLVALMHERTGVITSVPVLSRTLEALGLRRKKSRSARPNGTVPKSSTSDNGSGHR